MGSYNVAFRYTREAGGYHGVMTWTSFSSKEDFDKWYTPDIKAREEVVEEGISEERAIELTRSTPLACRVAAGIQEATGDGGKVDKKVDKAVLGMTIKNAIIAERAALR